MSRTDSRTADPAVIDAAVVDEYLTRIGHPGGPATLATLAGLTRAHVTAIPFENVDVVLEQHRGIGLDAVVDKLVRRRRGGYCYEHAGLLGAVLEHLGFDVRRVVARVQPEHGPNTHMALIVTVDGEEYLTDVGFGAGMLVPMPLVDGARVDQAGWTNRIEREGRCWTLIQPGADGTENRAYRVDPERAEPVDFEVFHHYTATHPASPFTGQLVVMRLEEGLSRRLVRTTLTHEHADGRVEQREVGVDTVVEELAGLGVELDADEAAALRAWWPAARG